MSVLKKIFKSFYPRSLTQSFLWSSSFFCRSHNCFKVKIPKKQKNQRALLCRLPSRQTIQSVGFNCEIMSSVQSIKRMRQIRAAESAIQAAVTPVGSTLPFIDTKSLMGLAVLLEQTNPLKNVLFFYYYYGCDPYEV